MGSSADWFIIAVIFLISIDAAAGFIAGVTSATGSSCSIVSPGQCWTNAGFPAAPASFVYSYSVPLIGGGFSLNLTPLFNVFL